MMKNITCVTAILFLFVFIYSCGDSTGISREPITIEYVSIQNGDSLNPEAGILIRFSDAIDLNSFNAQNIEQSVTLTYLDSSGIVNYPITLKIYKVHSAQNVLLKGFPQTFWYDPENYVIALFEETTVQMPAGTGEGLNINQDNSQLTINTNITSQNGGLLDEEFNLTINRANTPYQLRAVPNPLLLSYSTQGIIASRVNFTHLPATCQINIYNHNGAIIRSIQHNGTGVESWNLTGNDSLMIYPGIYQFDIVENLKTISGGVFVFPANE